MGTILVFISSLLLGFLFKKMNFFIVVALSVIVGMISSLFPGEDKLILDDIIFYTIISLCTVTLIKVGLKNKTKINKINNVIIGYFAIEDDEELKEGDDLVKRPSENMLGVVTCERQVEMNTFC